MTGSYSKSSISTVYGRHYLRMQAIYSAFSYLLCNDRLCLLDRRAHELIDITLKLLF